MDFSTFTVKAQEAIAGAQERAREAGNPETTSHHLLLALTDERDSVADVLLRACEADTARVRRASEEALAKLPSVRGSSVNAPVASLGLRSVLERAITEARSLGDSFTATEHLLLGLVETPGAVRDALSQVGVDKSSLLCVRRDLAIRNGTSRYAT